MSSKVEHRVARLESKAGAEILEIAIGHKTFTLSRADLTAVLREISEAGGDVGPGPSKPCFPKLE